MKLSTRYTPSRRLFLVLVILAGIGLVAMAWPAAAWIWLGGVALLGFLLLLEACLLQGVSLEQQSYTLSHQPSVQRPFYLTVQLKSLGKYGRFSLLGIQSDRFELKNIQPEVETLADEGALSARWEILPRKRGLHDWPGVLVIFKTPLGLLQKWQNLPPVSLKVYPALNTNLQLLNPALLLQQMGVKSNRHRRSDQIFESLKPYTRGDNYRHIDWKASARSGDLISRQYQMEHHHNILVCLDASRLMGTLTEGISKLDWAIEATLHLAYLADYYKDRIGLLVFSDEVERWVKPANRSMESFLASLYDIESRVVEHDLSQVCANILATQKKRSLVIFLSDFMEASELQPSLGAFGQLNRKHCGLFIGVEDPAYHKNLSANPLDSGLDIGRRLVAEDSMSRRKMALEQLKRLGVRAVTVTPENLVQRAMQAYLEVKLSGAI